MNLIILSLSAVWGFLALWAGTQINPNFQEQKQIIRKLDSALTKSQDQNDQNHLYMNRYFKDCNEATTETDR